MAPEIDLRSYASEELNAIIDDGRIEDGVLNAARGLRLSRTSKFPVNQKMAEQDVWKRNVSQGDKTIIDNIICGLKEKRQP